MIAHCIHTDDMKNDDEWRRYYDHVDDAIDSLINDSPGQPSWHEHNGNKRGRMVDPTEGVVGNGAI